MEINFRELRFVFIIEAVTNVGKKVALIEPSCWTFINKTHMAMAKKGRLKSCSTLLCFLGLTFEGRKQK